MRLLAGAGDTYLALEDKAVAIVAGRNGPTVRVGRRLQRLLEAEGCVTTVDFRLEDWNARARGHQLADALVILADARSGGPGGPLGLLPAGPGGYRALFTRRRSIALAAHIGTELVLGGWTLLRDAGYTVLPLDGMVWSAPAAVVVRVPQAVDAPRLARSLYRGLLKSWGRRQAVAKAVAAGTGATHAEAATPATIPPAVTSPSSPPPVLDPALPPADLLSMLPSLLAPPGAGHVHFFRRDMKQFLLAQAGGRAKPPEATPGNGAEAAPDATEAAETEAETAPEETPEPTPEEAPELTPEVTAPAPVSAGPRFALPKPPRNPNQWFPGRALRLTRPGVWHGQQTGSPPGTKRRISRRESI